MSKDTPRIVDNDRDEITVMLDGREIRGWFYANEQERRIKMLCACEFVESWYQAETSSLNRNGGSAWQPIETAPKDGTRILLARSGVEALHTAFWRSGIWHCGNLSYFNDPTHWMPLPEPPKGGDA